MASLSGRGTLVIGCLLLLMSCSVPRGAALQSEVLRNSDAESADFAVYPVTGDTLAQMAQWPATGDTGVSHWIEHRPGVRGQIIAAGDMIDISIWDSDQTSLIAGAQQQTSQLQSSVVSASGEIFVPYIGNVRISGMSPAHAREALQSQLTEVSPTGQLQLAVTPGRSNSVDLVSGTRTPGNFPMTDRTLTVLGLISLGGGVASDLENPRVTLIRGQETYRTSLSRLYSSSRYDTTLAAGDRVIIEEDARYFIALGATGRETIVAFETEEVTAIEAMALAGGVADARADLKGVLILRQYRAEDVARPGENGPENTRVIFTLDLTSADGLFSAGQFQIHPRDIVLATESPLTSTQTILGLVGRLVGISNALE